jgi:hypothetical protein
MQRRPGQAMRDCKKQSLACAAKSTDYSCPPLAVGRVAHVTDRASRTVMPNRRVSVAASAHCRPPVAASNSLGGLSRTTGCPDHGSRHRPQIVRAPSLQAEWLEFANCADQNLGFRNRQICDGQGCSERNSYHKYRCRIGYRTPS